MKSANSVKMLEALVLVLLVFSVTEGGVMNKCELKAKLDAAQLQQITIMEETITVNSLIARLVCKASTSAFNTSFVKNITVQNNETSPTQAPPQVASQVPPQTPSSGAPAKVPSSGSPPKDTSSGAPAKVPLSGSQPKDPSSGAPAKVPSSGSPPKDTSSGAPAKVPLSGSQPKDPSSGAPAKVLSSGSPPKDPSSGAPAKVPSTGSPPKHPSSGAPAKVPSSGSPPKDPSSGAPAKVPTSRAPPKVSNSRAPPKVPTSRAPSKDPSPRLPPQAPAGTPPKPYKLAPTKKPEGSSHETQQPHLSTATKVVGHLYGVFQLSDQVACDSGMIPSLNVCNITCSALTDDDITDDIACVKTLTNFMKVKPKDVLFDVKKIVELMLVKECQSVAPPIYFADCV